LRARIDRIITRNRRPGEVGSADSQTPRALHDTNNSLAPKIKLPTIEIPKFGGRITEFKHFHDTFNSLIINNQALDDVQKCHYLLSSVTSEAHQLIQNLPITEQNFHVAWNLVCDRYNNQRLIAAAHVKSLLSLPMINKESATDLRALINQFQSNLNAVKALDLGIPLHEVLSQILVEHEVELTRKQWEMKAVTQGVTEFEELIKFLEGKCQALELIHASQQLRDTNSNSSMSKQTKHAYVGTHN
jgi:diphosphomevalonate decarboxylase